MQGPVQPPIKNYPEEAARVFDTFKKFVSESGAKIRIITPRHPEMKPYPVFTHYVNNVEEGAKSGFVGHRHDVDCPLCRIGQNLPKGKMQFMTVGIQQVRFPRSKKKRIQKKWRSDRKNWAYTGDTHMATIPESVVAKLIKARDNYSVSATVGRGWIDSEVSGI